MSRDIIRLVNRKPTVGNRPIELRKKGLVYWLIDLSLSQVEVFSAPTSQAGYSQRVTVRGDEPLDLPRSSVRWRAVDLLA